jgi:hypothetical protein
LQAAVRQFHLLRREVLDQRLRHGESLSGHVVG